MNHKFLKRNYLNRRSALVAAVAAAFLIPLVGCEQEAQSPQRAEPPVQTQPQSQPAPRDQTYQQREQGDLDRQDTLREPGDSGDRPGTTLDGDRTGTGTATGGDRTGTGTTTGSNRPGG